MIPSPATQAQVALWRQKGRDGTLTQEEMRAAIVFLRAERTAMPASPSRAKTKPEQIDTGKLLGELGGL